MKAKILDSKSIAVIDFESKKQQVEWYYNNSLKENKITDEFIKPILKKKENKRTEDDLIKIILRKQLDDEYKNQLAELAEYKNYKPSAVPDGVSPLDSVVPYYEEVDGVIYQKWKVVKNDKAKINERISNLKKELNNGDYKIIKTFEAKIASKELPYDENELENLLNKRQLIRDEINELEKKLGEENNIKEQKSK